LAHEIKVFTPDSGVTPVAIAGLMRSVSEDRGATGEVGKGQAGEETNAPEITNCPLGIRILSASPLVHIGGLCFDAPTPSAQANFGIPRAKS